MKVVFISLFKRGFGGGEGRVAHELARYFAEEHNVVLICSADRTGFYEEKDSDVKVFGVQSAGNGEFHIPVLSGKTVRNIFDFLDDFSPDVIHAHEPALLGLIGQVWAKMHLVPFVHTSHVLPSKVLNFGAMDALDIKLLQGSLSSSVTRQVLTDFYENCDAIVALNQPALEALRDFGYEGKIYVIPNGRDLQKYQVCHYAQVAAQEKTLTFIGYISPRKNQIYLLKALRHLPSNYRLQLVGKPLNAEDGQHLRDYCEKHGLDNVTFTGQVPHEEIPSYLEKTHVFASASKMEVQSLVVIEALASGTPVVGLSNETIDEFVDENVGGWLSRDADPKEFANHIKRICDLSQSDYDELCANARERVSHLDWSNVIASTVDAYQDLLDTQRTSPSITAEEGAVLTNLISFLPAGEVKDILEARTSDLGRKAKQPGGLGTALLDKLKVLRRVPGSTWLMAGLTIVASVIGYLFMKGRNAEAG